MTTKDRAAGAVMGALIGDTLGLGPHWYYDLSELRRDYGDWITGYTNPQPHRYHGGLKAGQLSQAGIILTMLLRSVVEKDGYDEADFCYRLDQELFPRLDGTPMNGPGGYTSQSIREAWRRRVEQKLSWNKCGGHADTTEAIERALVLAARYAKRPAIVAKTVSSNCRLTQTDEAIVAMTTAYCCVLALLVQGEKLDPFLSDKLMELTKSGELPFHTVTTETLQPPKPGDPDPPRAGRFSSPDALLTPSYMAEAVLDTGIRIEPAWKVSIVYGMPCAISSASSCLLSCGPIPQRFRRGGTSCAERRWPESGALHSHRSTCRRPGRFVWNSETLSGSPGEWLGADHARSTARETCGRGFTTEIESQTYPSPGIGPG